MCPSMQALLTLLCALHCGSLSAAPAAKNRVLGSGLRLPRSLVPRHYDVKLTPIIEVNNFTIPGSVEILMNCLETTSEVVLHSADIAIDYSSIRVSHVATNQAFQVTNSSQDTTREFLIVTLATPLQAGQQYILFIKFTSILNDQLRGFYRSSYLENGQIKYLAISQMQATDARRAFPCFDEPNMKANFTITLGRKDSMSSASNMPLKQTIPVQGMPGYVWDVYETSLPMSTYLVAMLVSEFNALESPAGLSNTRFRIWTRPSASSQAAYASVIGPQVLKFYEDYFQIASPLVKQDMAAIPDFAMGAMENWGLITYRETELLYDPVISSAANKQRVVTVVAHELSHSWFGNLVTMDWWSDLWLNEGFAIYIQHIGADYVEPSMKIKAQILTDHIQFVYGIDALETSHPISVVVNHPAEINQLFDRISYSKGAAIIRMLAGFLGEETFKRGLTAYLNNKKYSNAVQDDLWAALTQQASQDKVVLPADVKTIMDTWTLKMGFPVINVTRNYNTRSATVTQDRFLLRSSGNSNDSTVYQWWVPLTYTSDFTGSTRIRWLSKDEKSKRLCLACAPDQWVVFNVDEMGTIYLTCNYQQTSCVPYKTLGQNKLNDPTNTGYYRVNYDERNWQLIRDQLIADHTKIGFVNRAQIMDDSLNLARVNLMPYATALDLTRYLQNEFEYLPWKSSLAALSYVDLMLSRTSGYGNFTNYMTRLITPLYNYVQFNETSSDAHLTILNRDNALTWACKLGMPDCVTNALSYYKAWMNDPNNTRYFLFDNLKHQPDLNLSLRNEYPDLLFLKHPQGKSKASVLSVNQKRVICCTAVAEGGVSEWNFAFGRYLVSNVATDRDTLLYAMSCSKNTSILAGMLEQSLNLSSGFRRQDAAKLFRYVAGNPAGNSLSFDFLNSRWTQMVNYYASVSDITKLVDSVAIGFNNPTQVDELKKFRDAHLNELGAATRSVEQSIEKAEANIKWVQQHYAEIVSWLQSH